MLKRSCPREGLRVFTSSEFEKFGDTSTTNLVSFVQSVELRNCRNFGTDISDISDIYICEGTGRCRMLNYRKLLCDTEDKEKKKGKKRNGTKVVCELLGRLRLYTLKREK